MSYGATSLEQGAELSQVIETPRGGKEQSLEKLQDDSYWGFWIQASLIAFGAGVSASAMLQLLDDVFEEDSGGEALFVGMSAALSNLTQVVSKLIYGPISDEWGRKPLLIMNAVSLTLQSAMLALMPTLPCMIVVNVLYALTAIDFLRKVLVLDITSHQPTAIASRFGYVYAAVAVVLLPGFVLGLVIPFQAGFLTAAGFFLMTSVFLVVYMPETLPLAQAHRMQLSESHNHLVPLSKEEEQKKRASHGGGDGGRKVEYNLWKLVQILDTNRTTRWLALAWFLRDAALSGLSSVFVAYTDEVFDWSSTEQGVFLTILGLSTLASFTVTRNIVEWLGAGRCLLWGAVSVLAYSAAIGVAAANQYLMYCTILALTPLGFVWSPVTTGVLASELPKTKQGHLQGAVDSTQCLGYGTGATFASLIYYWCTMDGGTIYFPQSYLVFTGFISGCSLYTCYVVVHMLGNPKLVIDDSKEETEPLVNKP